MAKEKTTGTTGGKLTFPKNWSQMNAAQRKQWQEENREGYAESRRAAKPAAAPQMGTAPEGQPDTGEEGAASQFNRNNAARSAQPAEPNYGEADDAQLADAVAQVDAGKVVAKILRTIADAFHPQE